MIRPITGRIILAFDLLALLLAWYVAPFIESFFQRYPSVETSSSFYDTSYLICSILLIFLNYNNRHYLHRIPWWSQVRLISRLCVGMMIFHASLLYFNGVISTGYCLLILWPTVLASMLMIRQVSRMFCMLIGLWPTRTVVIGDSNNLADILHAINSDAFPGFDVHTILLKDDSKKKVKQENLPTKYKNIEMIEVNGDYLEYIQEHDDDFYIVSMDPFRGKTRDELIELFHKVGAHFVIVPPLRRESLYGMEPYIFFGFDTVMLRPKDNIHSPFGHFTKRSMDLLGAITALILLSPVMLVISLMIKKSGGSIFFGHNRIGVNGKEFKCLKFRSMVPNAQEVLQELLKKDPKAKKEWEKDFKLKDDPRITPIGNFLRKTSLDELPQLFNVIKGEMSLVGPRPIVESEKKYYGVHIRNYLAIRPGITGLWQVSGRNDITYQQRVYMDSWYVRNWSLWHDLVIIFKTVRTLINRNGAY